MDAKDVAALAFKKHVSGLKHSDWIMSAGC